jgi:hypothetical protein
LSAVAGCATTGQPAEPSAQPPQTPAASSSTASSMPPTSAPPTRGAFRGQPLVVNFFESW